MRRMVNEAIIGFVPYSHSKSRFSLKVKLNNNLPSALEKTFNN